MTLRHLLMDTADNEDVCGLQLVRAALSVQLHKSFALPEYGHWVVTFPKWCHNSLKKEIIDWTVETFGHLQLESEYRLQGSNPLWILSIVNENNHVFVGD